MRAFADIRDLALERHPDLDAKIAEHLGHHLADRDALRARSDDRWLAVMTKCVFQSGFVWKVIEAKWDGFEVAFDGFDPSRVSFYSDDDIARLASDARIVRNGPKIAATVENARFVAETSAAHGGFGNFMADWPATDQVGLMELMKARGGRIGGLTGQYVLRFSGWGGWILSKDVVAALIRDGVVDKPPTSKKALAAVQDAMNAWAEEGGVSHVEVSRTLAMSVG